MKDDGAIASKAEMIRHLLLQNEYGTTEVAAIVQCSPRFVRMMKARCRASNDPRNWQVRVARVEQELRDHRSEIAALARAISSQSRQRRAEVPPPAAESCKMAPIRN